MFSKSLCLASLTFLLASVTMTLIPIGGLCPAFGDSTLIQVNGADVGRTFDGIGALSAGASSRLLIDYPAKQRSEILDYLFKPDYGAALQINKVEIGGDANSTDGAEASHERTPVDRNYHRGYEWWLMAESKRRNPAEKLYILEWAAPGWLNPGHNSTWTQANCDYIVDFINHAKSDYGLSIDYAGGWNERGYDIPWYEAFRKALNANGYSSIKIIGDDSFGWQVGKDIAADPAFASSVDIIGQHYEDYSPAVLKDPKYQVCLNSGKPLWFSEMGSQDYNTGAYNLVKAFIESYIDDRVTANINWSTIWSVYGGLPYSGCGLMLANEPWSGHYVVGKSIWACAHVTQFAQPGWQFLDGACGFLGSAEQNGGFVTLKSPNNFDYSVIIETLDAKVSQQASFAVSGGLSTEPLHVWATELNSDNAANWFTRQPDIQPSNGEYTMTLLPGFVYSITTTSGQTKGKASSPPSELLPLPYHENFGKYPVGATPRYFSDQQGAFEIARAGGGRGGNCLRQVITSKPIQWAGDGDPSTVVGDWRWTNYTVSSDILLEQPGYVDIIGRMESCSSGNSNNINGYHLRVTDRGAWSLIRKNGPVDNILISGVVPFSLNTWHSLKLELSGLQMTGAIDGVVVAKNVLAGDFDRGLAGYQVSSWRNAEFQNFAVTAAPAGSAIHSIRPVSATATSQNDGYPAGNAVDGDTTTLWHTKYEPVPDALPQSITVDLGEVKTINALEYYPRNDGNNHGDITKYEIDTSTDGVAFTRASSGDWVDDSTRKIVGFNVVQARYIRVTALEGDGGFASAAEIDAAMLPD